MGLTWWVFDTCLIWKLLQIKICYRHHVQLFKLIKLLLLKTWMPPLQPWLLGLRAMVSSSSVSTAFHSLDFRAFEFESSSDPICYSANFQLFFFFFADRISELFSLKKNHSMHIIKNFYFLIEYCYYVYELEHNFLYSYRAKRLNFSIPSTSLCLLHLYVKCHMK